MGTTSFPHLWENILGEIDEVCCDFDKSWRRRLRIIDTKLIVSFIFQIVLSQNSCGYATTLFELWSCFRARGERPKKLKPVAASSMCEARQKLDENIFKVINSRLVKAYENKIPAIDNLWHGRRIFAVDGSKILLPMELFSKGFNISSTDPRCPQGLASCLYNIKTKVPYDFTLVEHGDERLAASEHLEYLIPGDCVVYDRGYFGYVFLHQHKNKGIDAVFRISDGPVFQPIREFMDDPLEPSEKIVTILPSESTKKDIKKRYKDIEIVPIELRIIRYRIGETIYFLATTLTSDEFTTEIFQEIYHSRWGVEIYQPHYHDCPDFYQAA